MSGLDPRRLIFVIGPPRGGTTLLMRMLHAHSQIQGMTEPHIIPPLAHLGFYHRVHKAPYDPIQTHLGQQALVRGLPGGEQTYIDALRACTDVLYGALAGEQGHLVDKTPANALVLPFLRRLYPDATYVVLTRHPFAVWCSYARSFFDDDWDVAHAHNPILERYIPAIASFLRQKEVANCVHVTYETMVTSPAGVMSQICEAAGLPFEPTMIEYGQAPLEGSGPGDPITVKQHTRPTDASVHRWAADVADDPIRRSALDRMLRRVSDEDLQQWGFPRPDLWTPMATPQRPIAARKWTRHRVERATLVALRKNVHHGPLGRALRQARFALDVLLRE
ncbi:MAG: sulfotransferase [Myxococcota bacterium]